MCRAPKSTQVLTKPPSQDPQHHPRPRPSSLIHQILLIPIVWHRRNRTCISVSVQLCRDLKRASNSAPIHNVNKSCNYGEPSKIFKLRYNFHLINTAVSFMRSFPQHSPQANTPRVTYPGNTRPLRVRFSHLTTPSPDMGVESRQTYLHHEQQVRVCHIGIVLSVSVLSCLECCYKIGLTKRVTTGELWFLCVTGL